MRSRQRTAQVLDRKMAGVQARGKGPEMDPPLRAVVETVPKFVSLLRAWADKLEKRHETFSSLESDLNDLFAHTEQLSTELEKSRPTAPVYKNAEDALKKAVARTAKVLKDLQGSVEAIKTDLSPPASYDGLFDHVESALKDCIEYTEVYREGCKNFETSGDILASGGERKDKKAKKENKERKRSSSPKRSKEKSATLMS